MATELSRERLSSTIHISELTTFLDGGDRSLSVERKKLLKELSKYDKPGFKPEDVYFETPEEGLERIAKTIAFCAELKKKKELTPGEAQVMTEIIGDNHYLDGIHSTMFIPFLEMQANDEQKEKWIPLAKQYRILGTYAQTEMGHGTNVRGLETTATYDVTKQEFVLNTNSITAYKFWPGSLGHISTHAIVFARLITGGVDYGVHPFIVQIRSLEDHTPMPGVTVGDIGPKIGYVEVDNGFLSLDSVRIPRTQMLMRFSRVEPDGTYVKPPVAKIGYETMVQIRSVVVADSAWSLCKAVTIATRYSVVRKQGNMDDHGPECQVLDYQTQQLQLLPLIASAYILKQVGYQVIRQFNKIKAEIAAGKYDNMQELHATTSGMKAFTSYLALQGVETCRQACGGHGYSKSSGLPDICLGYMPSVVYEGINPVLFLQTGRYLNKILSLKKHSSDLPFNVSYLGTDFKLHPCNIRSSKDYLDPDIQLSIYQQRACRMIKLASERLQCGLSRGLKYSQAWNDSTCDWIAAANAHCHYMAVKAFRDSLSGSNLSPVNMSIMNSLCALFVTHGLISKAGEFMMDDFMTPDQVSLAREQLYYLLKIVRKEAVPLVDAFDLSDRVLRSTLGRYDGDVYTALLEWAKKAPRNKDEVHPVYQKHLKKLLQSKL